MANKVINTILNLRDNFSSGLKKAAASTGTFRQQLRAAENASNKMIKSVKTMAKATAGIGTALGGAAIVSSLNTYKEFEQAMASTAATAGISQTSEDFQKMQKAARAAGRATTKTAAESANALNYMSLAGWSVNDSIDGLMPILRLSEATQADLATTSDLVTDSMSALGISVGELRHYLDVAAVANNKSNQTAQMLMEAYIGVGGTFKRLETPLSESAALLGVLANRGIKGSEAGNSLNSLLINLTKTSGESAQAMKALNISTYDSKGKFKGVTNVLRELNEKTKGLTDEQRDMYLQMIGGKTQITTLNALMSGLNTTNAEGVNELEALSQQLLNTNGALDTMAETVNNTLSGALARFSSAVSDAKIELGEKLAPVFAPIINSLAEKIPVATEKFGKAMDKATSIAKNFWKLAGRKYTWYEGNELKKEIASLTGLSTESITKIGNKIRWIQDAVKNFGAVIKNVFTVLTIDHLYSHDLDEARKALSKITGIDTKTITKGLLKIRSLFKGGFKTARPILLGIVSAFGSFIVITKVVSFFVKLSKAAKTFTGILKFLNLTMLASPFTWIAIGIGLLVAALVVAYQKSEKFRAIVHTVWEKLKLLGEALKNVVIAKLKELAQWYDTTLKPKLKDLGDSMLVLWNEVLEPFVEYLSMLWSAGVAAAFTYIGETFSNLVDIFMGLVDNFITVLQGITDFLIGIFTGDWERAWDGVKEIFSGVFGGLKTIAFGIINGIIGGINGMIAGINNFAQSVAELPGMGWVGEIKIKPLKKIGESEKGASAQPKAGQYATGTQYFSGGLAEINEHGGEIVNLPSGAKIIPADKSRTILEKSNSNVTVNINVNGNLIGNQEAARQMGETIVRQLRLAMGNM